VSPAQKAALDELAKATSRSRAALIREAIELLLRRYQADKP
jgi:predicted transcriptional regulator